MARQKFPGQPANLDALCRRFGIDNSERTFHGALLDSELLAEVYLELLGGRQHGLLGISSNAVRPAQEKAIQRPFRAPREFLPSKKELKAHEELLGKLTDALWNKLENFKKAG
jgi:DNA polymerase-3 subunit epsilon